MKKKKIICYILMTIMIMIGTFIIFGFIDVNRFMNNEKPIFIIKEDTLNDGGTKIYYGVGYQLIDWRRIDDEEITELVYLEGKEYHIIFFSDVINGEPNVELKRE